MIFRETYICVALLLDSNLVTFCLY